MPRNHAEHSLKEILRRLLRRSRLRISAGVAIIGLLALLPRLLLLLLILLPRLIIRKSPLAGGGVKLTLRGHYEAFRVSELVAAR